MNVESLRARIEELARRGEEAPREEARQAVGELLDALERGEVRAATPEGGGWTVHPWVKKGVVLGFRHGDNVPMPPAGPLAFRDKDLYPPRRVDGMPGVRVVPGGTAVRRGAHVGEGVILMPPAYVNVAAYVGAASMIDSHALVGSCAQLGEGIHLSAGAQVGGVLEPAGAMPVIVEDEAFVGGLAGLFEGVLVRRRAVIGAGVVLTSTTPLFDLVRERRVERREDGVLEVPENAVVIAGTRQVGSSWARERGIAGAAALIVKERDAGTDARAALEDALR